MFLFFFCFAEDEGEVFQVKKTSQSKKVMKMLDKERRKKKKNESHGGNYQNKNGHDVDFTNEIDANADSDSLINKKKPKDANTDSSTHTEIRTDDFVVRILLYNFVLYISNCNLFR